MAARHREPSDKGRQAKPAPNSAESKVSGLLESDLLRESRKFVDDLTHYSWNQDESPFRETDNVKVFRDATHRLLEVVKSAIQKRFAEAWAIFRNRPEASQADAAESSRKLIRETVTRCWDLKAMLQKVPQFTVMDHIVPLFLPPGLPDVEPLCMQTDSDVLSHVDQIADSVAVAGIVSIDVKAMLGERASQLYDDLDKLQKYCGRSIPDEKKLRLTFPLSIWRAIDESSLTEERRTQFFTNKLRSAAQPEMFRLIGDITGHSEPEIYAAYKHYRDITGTKRKRRSAPKKRRRRKRH